MRMIGICFLFMCMLADAAAEIHWEKQADNGFSAKVIISNDQITLQDELEVQLILTYPQGYSFDKNSLNSNLLQNPTLNPSPFVVASEKVAVKNGITVLDYILDPQVPGKAKLSFYDITFRPDDPKKNKPVTLTSDLFTITINEGKWDKSFEPEPSEVMTFSERFPIQMNSHNRKALKQLAAHESSRNQEIMRERTLPWKDFLAALTGIAFLAFLRYGTKKQPPDPQKVILSAQNKALDNLNQLRQKALPQKKAFADYYTQLSDTVRFYIEDRFQLKAPRETTQEFLADISKKPLPPQFPKEDLSRFLVYSDQVKFGKLQPSENDCEKAFNAALNFIEKG